MRKVLALSAVLLSLLGLLACGDDDSSIAAPKFDVSGQLSNGSDLANISTHWNSQGTTGSLLIISFLDDGSGQLNFSNDSLYGNISRRLHDFQWEALTDERIRVTIEMDGGDPVVFILTDVAGDIESGSMSATIDNKGEPVQLNLSLGSGPPPCC